MHSTARYLSLFTCFFVLTTIQVNPQDPVEVLELGKPIEKELKGGETRTFQLSVLEHQYLYLIADQKGIDIAVSILGPGRKRLREVNWLIGSYDPERVPFISDTAGVFFVEVRSTNSKARPGRFELKLEELRHASSDDRAFTTMINLLMEGQVELAARKPDSAAQAIEKAKLAAVNLDQLANQKQKAVGMSHLSTIYYRARSFDDAAAWGKLAAELFEALEMKRDAFFEYLNLGTDYGWIYKRIDSLRSYEKALAIAVGLNDKDLEAVALTKLGVFYSQVGDFENSLDYYLRALQASYEFGGKSSILSGLLNAGLAYANRGDNAQALSIYQEYQRLQKETGITGGEISVLVNIGNVYSEEGNLDLALRYYQDALAQFRAGSFGIGETYSLENIGNVYFKRGKYEEGLKHYEEGLALRERLKLPLTTTYMNVGLAYKRLGNLPKAAESFLKAREWAERTGNKYFAGASQRSLGDVYLSQRKLDEADALADTALALGKERRYGDVEGQALILKARVSMAREQNDLAIKPLLDAVDIVENIRKRGGEAGGGGFLIPEPYKLLIKIWSGSGEHSKALEFSELIKARATVDMLRDSKRDRSKFMTAAEIEQERNIKLEMNSLNTQVRDEYQKPKINKDEVNRLETEQTKKRFELEDLLTRLYSKYPELRLRRGNFAHLVAKDVTALIDNNTVAVEFVVVDDEIFAIVADGSSKAAHSIHTYAVQSSAATIEKLSKSFMEKTAAGDLEFRGSSKELYEALLGPVAAQLDGKSKLIVVPEKFLWDLPFQALMDENGKFLAEKMAISYAPSLTALREMKKKAGTRNHSTDAELLAFGNPIVAKETTERVQRVFMSEKMEPIPEAERLVNELGRMYGPGRSKVFTGRNAREETAKTEAPKYRIVQFATHGILNNASPMYSHLVLAQDEKNPNEDGLLEAWELKDLDLKADMVILSACDTARGKISGGEGVIGMTWAAFIAGAPTTVASQWKVESSSTTEFMLEFHRQMLANKKISKAEALRRASLKLMKSTRYRHPSYWAPWILVGDGS